MAFYGLDPIRFESVSAVTATNSVELGTRVLSGELEYTYVYNAGNSQISVKRACVLSAVTGYSVTVSSATDSANAPLFGVVVNATLTTATYGWVATRGLVEVMNAMASTAISGGGAAQLQGDGAFGAATSTVLSPYFQLATTMACGACANCGAAAIVLK